VTLLALGALALPLLALTYIAWRSKGRSFRIGLLVGSGLSILGLVVAAVVLLGYIASQVSR